jgi:general secretion pathway protein D
MAAATFAVVLPSLSRGEEVAPSLDDIELDTKVDPNVPIDAEKWLRLWADRLHLPIFADPQMQGVKIRFLQQDLKLTWGVAKQILSFHDILLEEKNVNGHSVMFAHMRRNATVKIGLGGPVIPIDGADEIEKKLPQREEIVTALVQITNGAASDMMITLRGLLPHDINHLGNILHVRGPEVLLIVDYASNVQYYLKIIKALDIQAHGQETRIIQVEHALAADVAKVLSQLLKPANPGASLPGSPSVGVGSGATLLPPQIIADERTNQIFVQAYDYQWKEIEKDLAALDKETPPQKQNLHIYKCRYVDAAYLAGELSELLTGQAAQVTGRQKKQAGSGATTPPSGGVVNLQQPAAPGQQAAKQDFNAVATRIVPDLHQNALIIQCDEKVWKQIEPLLLGGVGRIGLDVPQRVILIEAQIWEIATPTDTTTIGFELADVENPVRGQLRPALGTSYNLTNISLDPTTQQITRTPNIQNGFVGLLTAGAADKIPIIMEAVASLENSRLVTTPFTLTNDNTEAEFDIDNQIPYPTSTLGGGGLATTGVAFTDVKTQLTVTPQVNSDDNLTLDVEVQLSSVGANGGPNLPPSTNTRHYKGEVTVPNMQYVVFGGLESESWDETEKKVPYVGDLPVVGMLFKNKTWSHTRSKIYIFLRPTIFRDDRGLVGFSHEAHELVHVEAQRDEWIPAICSDRWVDPARAGKTLQDDVFDTFGPGSGNPFSRVCGD